MNKRLGRIQIILGSMIAVLGIIGSFLSLFIGGMVVLFGLWNVFVGIQVRRGRPLFDQSKENGPNKTKE